MSEPVLVAWSGGKDSALALQAVLADPAMAIEALLTTVTREYDRISVHGVRRSLLLAQVAALGLPLVEMEIPADCSNATYEENFAGALRAARERNDRVNRCVFGDLFLEDVRRYREERLAPLGWQGVFPIWGRETSSLARAFLDDGFRAVVVCVDSTLLAPSFSGREYDASFFDDLPGDDDPCGENGEFHTFVFDGPLFRKRVEFTVGERVTRDERFVYTDLVPRVAVASP
ncbi:MAG TPA: hypothetical protein VK511_02930 [Gemmatimonadaceae bacterium]|nr:hypothetical protein [Gemmatimonadaceae bacterium]